MVTGDRLGMDLIKSVDEKICSKLLDLIGRNSIKIVVRFQLVPDLQRVDRSKRSSLAAPDPNQYL